MPRVRASRTEVRIARRVPASSAVGDAFRSRPARIEPSAFHRVSQRPPLRRQPCWSPLPRACARFGPASPDAALVPPTPFLPASTASSSCRFAGLLRPASDPGVHRVATLRRRMPATTQRFPTDACPSELLPPEKRFSRHRESLPPCRSTATPLRLRGLVPLGNPLRQRFVAEPHRPMLSWASQLGAPPGHASRSIRERTGRSHQGSARTQTDPVARSTRSVPPPPEGSDHTERTGKERSGRHHCRATIPADQRPSATPPKRCPRRSAPRTTSSSQANPAAPREVIGSCRHDSPEGARTASASELSMVPCAAWFDRRSGRPRLLHRVP